MPFFVVVLEPCDDMLNKTQLINRFAADNPWEVNYNTAGVVEQMNKLRLLHCKAQVVNVLEINFKK